MLMNRALLPLVALLAAVIGACGGNDAAPQELPTRVQLAVETETPTPSPVASATLTPDKPEDVLLFWFAEDETLSPDEPDIWRFEAEAGDGITVRVVGVDVLMTVQAADGRIITSGESIRTTLEEAGNYTVIVQAAEGDPGGSYQIGLGYSDRPNPFAAQGTPVPEVVGIPTPTPAYSSLGTFISQIADEQTIGGTLTEDLTPHVYTFEGAAGTYIRVDLNRVTGDIDPILTLFDPEGVAIATDDDSGDAGNAVLLNVQLPADGLYSILAQGDQPGGYSVTLLQYDRRAPVTPVGPTEFAPTPVPTFFVPTPGIAVPNSRLTDHTPLRGVIASPGDLAIYSISATQGQVFTIGAGGVDTSNVRLRMEVSDPEGNLVGQASSTNGEPVLITPLRADYDGVYQVFLTALDETTGPYIISYGIGSTRLDVNMGQPPRDQPSQGVVRERGARDVWNLELQAGDIITAGVNPADPVFDPIIEIVPADEPGTVIAIDDNGGGDRAAFIRRAEIPRDGVYLLRVRASQAASTGPYTLVWRYINVAPTPTVAPATYPLLTVDDAVPEQAYRFYPFQGFAGQRVSVRVQAVNDSFDPVLAIISPDGREVISVDDSDDSLNPRAVLELPADGTYQVRVNGYLSGGEFFLLVEEVFE